MNITYDVAETAAKRLAAGKLAQGFVIEALHTYSDADGNSLYWRIRLKHPKTGEKVIWPMHQNSEGAFVLKEPSFPGKKPLYKLQTLANNTDDAIWIVEGELCADTLEALRLLATTSGGSSSASMADWLPLKNRNIIIWPDNDEAGIKYTKEVAALLNKLGCKVKQIDLGQLHLNNKEDCVDWFKKNPGATQQDIESLPMIEINCGDSLKTNLAQHASNKSSAILLELIQNIELFHDEQKQAYVGFNYKGKPESLAINSHAFKNWLTELYWEKQQKPASETTLQEVISILSNKAQYEGKRYTFFTRVGHLGKTIYLDLANDQNQVIEISANGWKILNKAPVKFRHLPNLKSLPLPKIGGTVDLLWRHLNIAEEDQKLVLAWILDCWIPYTHFPILVLTGLHGSAKSTTQDILRKIIDPNTCSLRSTPRHSDDIPIAAANNWLVSYNNISKLSQQHQDDLCCLSTGGGFAKRKLFSNTEEASINLQRPVILNGISNPVSSQDLISRSIIIDLPIIHNRQRKLESELRESFKQDHPLIFGALLDLLVKALNYLPDAKLEEKPRLADFAMLGITLEHVLKWTQGSFMKSYEGNYQTQMILEAEDSPVTRAIMKLMHDQTQFRGTFGELFELINTPHYKSESISWPNSPKGLANILKREVAALEIAHIEVSFSPHRTRHGYLINITKKPSHDTI